MFLKHQCNFQNNYYANKRFHVGKVTKNSPTCNFMCNFAPNAIPQAKTSNYMKIVFLEPLGLKTNIIEEAWFQIAS